MCWKYYQLQVLYTLFSPICIGLTGYTPAVLFTRLNRSTHLMPHDVVWRPAPFALCGRGSGKKQTPKLKVVQPHCGRRRANQVNPGHDFRLRASRQSYCQIKIT